MEHKQGRFRQLESLLTMILYVNIAIFIGYLVTAALGIVVAKIILAVLTILLSLSVNGCCSVPRKCSVPGDSG